MVCFEVPTGVYHSQQLIQDSWQWQLCFSEAGADAFMTSGAEGLGVLLREAAFLACNVSSIYGVDI